MRGYACVLSLDFNSYCSIRLDRGFARNFPEETQKFLGLGKFNYLNKDLL
jgi:hypothetical protein